MLRGCIRHAWRREGRSLLTWSWHSGDLHSHLREHAVHFKDASKHIWIRHGATKFLGLHVLSYAGTHCLKLRLAADQVVDHPRIGEDLAHRLLEARLKQLERVMEEDTCAMISCSCSGEGGAWLPAKMSAKSRYYTYDLVRTWMRWEAGFDRHIEHQ